MTIQKPHPDAEELLADRTACTKTFLMPDGRRKLVTRLRPEHYEHAGQWHDIDTAITVKGENFTADQLPFEFRIHRLGIGYDYTSKSGGSITVVLESVGGDKVDGERFFEGDRSGNEVLFRDVAEGLDLRFVVHQNGVRTYRILKSEKAAKEWRWRITGDEAGLAKIGKRFVGGDASGRELAGLSMAIEGDTVVETWDGSVINVDPLTRIKSVSSEAVYPVEIDPDIVEDIAANAHDSQSPQTGYGNPYVTRFTWNASAVYRTAAMFRFTSVAVDNAASIGLAELILNFASPGDSAGEISGMLYDDMPNPNDIGGWSLVAGRTTAKTGVAASLSGIQTFDVTGQVQEIVNQGGWASGNDMGLIIDPVGTAGGGTVGLEDLSTAGGNEARLEITLAAATSNRRRRLLLGA